MADGTSDRLSDPYRQATPSAQPPPEKPPEKSPEPAAPSPAPAAKAPDPAAPVDQDDDVLTGALDDDDDPNSAAAAEALSHEMSAEPEDDQIHDAALTAAAQASQRVYRPTDRPARKKGFDLKEMAVPLFVTVGGLLLIPAIWAVCILAGADVPGSDRPDAKTMGLVMLAAWPIAGALLAAAWVFWKQVKRRKAAQAATTKKR